MSISSSTVPPQAVSRSQRAVWLKRLYRWHWISSALALTGWLLFAITGFTLNHAASLEALPKTQHYEAQLPADLLAGVQALRDDLLANAASGQTEAVPLPAQVRLWLNQQWHLELPVAAAEWSQREVNISLPRPGGDGWLRINLRKGLAEYESTDKGWLAYLNDLHKGHETGTVWRWFLDLFSLTVLVAAVTGLFILKLHAPQRALVWPLVGLGLALPLLLAVLFIH